MPHSKIIIFLLTVLLSASTFAADLFTVDGIKVSSGGGAKHAKEAAVLAGQREAFGKLLERIASDPSKASLVNIDSAKVSEMVQGMEVNDEKITASHYSATLNISFNRSFVEKFLKDNNTEFAAKKSAPIVVIPLLVGPDGKLEFESEHPWRLSLANSAKASHVLNVTILPSLRSVDKSKLSQNIEDISSDTKEALLKIGQSYNAERLIIAVAMKDVVDAEKLNIRMQDIKDPDGAIKEVSFKATDKQAGEDIFACAARNLVSFLESQWVKGKTEIKASLAKISLTVPISSLEEWANLRKRLENTGFLKDITVKALTLSYALVDVSFKDSYEAVVQKMSESGFDLENTGDAVILRVRGQNHETGAAQAQ